MFLIKVSMLPWQMNKTFIIVLFLLNLPGMLCFARFSGFIVKCSEITDCGKLEQNPASCYYLLVVKLVVKGTFLLLSFLSKCALTYYSPERTFLLFQLNQILPILMISHFFHNIFHCYCYKLFI